MRIVNIGLPTTEPVPVYRPEDGSDVRRTEPTLVVPSETAPPASPPAQPPRGSKELLDSKSPKDPKGERTSKGQKKKWWQF